MSKPKPLNTKLYNRVKKMANKKFKSKTGIYHSSWLVKKYKELGGKYTGKPSDMSGLRRWYREKWVDVNRKTKSGYEKCGRKSISRGGKYPLCRPTKRISNKTPKTLKELNKSSIKKANRIKQKYKTKKNVQFGKGNTNNNTNVNFFVIASTLFLGWIFC